MAKVWVANMRGDKAGTIAFPSAIPVIVNGLEQIGWRQIQYTDGVFEVNELDLPKIVVVGCRNNVERAQALKSNKGPVYGVISVGDEKPSASFVETQLSTATGGRR